MESIDNNFEFGMFKTISLVRMICEIFISKQYHYLYIEAIYIFYNQTIEYLWNKQQDVKMGRLPETSRVPQKSCGKPI